MAQMTIDETAAMLDKQAASPLSRESYTGQITKVSEMTNAEVYGDKAKDPDRVGWNIQIQIPELNGRTFHEFFNLPKDEISWLNPQFKLRHFVKRYGGVPKVGMAVKCIVNADGFFNILM